MSASRRAPQRVAIVGAGVTGLATAFRLERARPDWQVVVLEAAPQVGGKARTTVRDGYTVDWGPNGFVASAPHTLQLVQDAGLAGELQPASEAARLRYLYRDGGLRPLPASPPAFLASEVVPWQGRLRAALEVVLATRGEGEESVDAFLTRHFGGVFASALGEAFVSGITAGDPRELSLDALFPRLRAMEREHRSLVRALLARQRAARRRRAPPAGRGGAGGNTPGGSGPGAGPGPAGAEAAGAEAAAASATGPATPGPATIAAAPAPTGRLTSFRHGGMQRLLTGLRQALRAELRLGARVEALEPLDAFDGESSAGRDAGHRDAGERQAGDPHAGGAHAGRADAGQAGPRGGAATRRDGVERGTVGPYRLRLSDGSEAIFDRVVLTLPAPEAARLLRPHLPEASSALEAIPYAGVRVFGLGFDRVHVPRSLDGFGFLVPRGQGVRSLGVLWTSTLYPGRAPDGKVLLRALAGGRLDPDMLELSDDQALAAVLHDLHLTMGIAAEPEFVEAVRWQRAIPQYTLGHGERLRRIDTALQALPGVHLAGNAYRGVGVNDCVREAERVVAALLASG